MTGNFYCIPSQCARVVYQEYLAPAVRWRYPGEDWQEIKGDDYLVKDNTGLDPDPTTKKLYEL